MTWPLNVELLRMAYIASTAQPTESLIVLREEVDVYDMQQYLYVALTTMRYVKHIEFQRGNKALVAKVVRIDDSVSLIYVLNMTSKEIIGRRITGMLLYFMLNPDSDALTEEQVWWLRFSLLPCITTGAHVARVS